MSSQLKAKVNFFYELPVTLNNRNKLKRFIERMFKREGQKLRILNYIFCSDSQILKINREFLKHNYYTDIITFEFSERGIPVEGEVYISVGRIKENSKLVGDTYTRELHRVIFHGALHLCGYTDKNALQISKMREAENYYLKKYLKV